MHPARVGRFGGQARAAVAVASAVACSALAVWEPKATAAGAARDGSRTLSSADAASPRTLPLPRGAVTVFAWAPAPGARSYRVWLYRADRLVFTAVTRRPRVELPRRWTFGGRSYRLSAGRYRWYVWPLFGPSLRPGKAVVQATYRL